MVSLSVHVGICIWAVQYFRRIRFLLRLILIDDGSVFLNIMSELNVIWGRLAISDCIFPVFSLSCATQILATVILK